MPKILVGCPTSEAKSYCEKEYLSFLQSLTYPFIDILLVVNGTNKDYYNHLKSLGYKCVFVSQKNKVSSQFIAESHEELKIQALIGRYDYLFHLESDVIPTDKNIIEKLMVHNKPIISGLYPIGFGHKSYFFMQKEVDFSLKHYHSIVENIDDGADLIAIDGTVKPVFSSGLGCVLIHRSVLEKISFRYEDGKDFHPDTYFYIDLYKNGIQHFVDTSILCNHLNKPWGVLGATELITK